MNNKYQEAIDCLTKIQQVLVKLSQKEPKSQAWMSELEGFSVAIRSLEKVGENK